MVIASFLVKEKDESSYFFERTFLLANISIDVALGMFFLTLGNVKVNFTNWELKLRLYITSEVFPTI